VTSARGGGTSAKKDFPPSPSFLYETLLYYYFYIRTISSIPMTPSLIFLIDITQTKIALFKNRGTSEGH